MVDKYVVELVKSKHGELVYTADVIGEIEDALSYCGEQECFDDVKQVLTRLLRILS